MKAVIFDCFGVLTSDAWLPFKQRQFGHDPALLAEAGRLNMLADSGQISYRQFLAMVADLAAMSVREVDAAISKNIANQPLFHFIANELHGRYKIGMLSNAAGNWLDSLFSPEQLQLFDAILLSYETGVSKPAAAAYRNAAQTLAVPVGDCLFIDDLQRYTVAAEAVGMKAICYMDVDSCLTEMRQILKIADTNK